MHFIPRICAYSIKKNKGRLCFVYLLLKELVTIIAIGVYFAQCIE